MSAFNLLTGAGIGAGLAYLFDPVQGNRRRSLLRDQVVHAMTKSCAGADATWRDIRHRSYGTMAEMRGALSGDDASDDVLCARVRSKIGRYVSHPSSIEVKANDGRVTLSGPILAHEVDDLMTAVSSVKGVSDMENRLEVHETAGDVPGLQGGRRGIDVKKTIVIDRPIDEVFDLLCDPKNYPKFTDVVQSVREQGDGRYLKTMVGPGGAPLSIPEKITRLEPNQFVAVRSEPDSPIKYSMTARFEPVGDSSTRVQLCATYNPPGGVVTDALGRVAGYDMKSQLEDTLVRAKSYLETGKQPHDAAEKRPMEASRT